MNEQSDHLAIQANMDSIRLASQGDALSFFTRRDNRLSVASIRCSTMLPNVDCNKARKELGWAPEPIEKSIAEAVHFYRR